MIKERMPLGMYEVKEILDSIKAKSIQSGDIFNINTDNYTDLEKLYNDDKFNENSKYDPKNPYSATKAASDLLVKSFINTYKINAVVTNCSNNYGPY